MNGYSVDDLKNGILKAFNSMQSDSDFANGIYNCVYKFFPSGKKFVSSCSIDAGVKYKYKNVYYDYILDGIYSYNYQTRLNKSTFAQNLISACENMKTDPSTYGDDYLSDFLASQIYSAVNSKLDVYLSGHIVLSDGTTYSVSPYGAAYGYLQPVTAISSQAEIKSKIDEVFSKMGSGEAGDKEFADVLGEQFGLFNGGDYIGGFATINFTPRASTIHVTISEPA